MNLNEKKKCKSGGNCCKKCRKKKIGLGWGNPDSYGATPVGSATMGESHDILEELLKAYIREFK